MGEGLDDVGCADPPGMKRLLAPAKLTRTLRVVGRRSDGYHLLESEMVAISLADELVVGPGRGLAVEADWSVGEPALEGAPPPCTWPGVPEGRENLVWRALEAVGAADRVQVRVRKRIPPGAGLGGGSADAAAVLRWAGVRDPAVALRLGADVPFCVLGGRAMVRGVGEVVEPLPFERGGVLVLTPPLAVSTPAVYRGFDELGAGARGGEPGGNDLEAAALVVEPRLRSWRALLEALTGRRPTLAGSGSSWFVPWDEEPGPDVAVLEAEVARFGGRLRHARFLEPFAA